MKTRLVVLVLAMLCFNTAAVDKDWQVRKGRNFIVFSHNVPEDFVDTVMDEAETDFQSVTQNLGITRYQNWAWDKRASIYIYHDEEDYVKNGGQAGWSHGAALVESKMIKTFPSANGFFDSVLPHELGHIILHDYLGHLVEVPLWFDEGVAMYQEKARRLGAHQMVKEAIENSKFIPLAQLMDMRLYNDTDQETVQLFYAESASIVNYMITELGLQHFYKLCRELKDNNTRFTDALPMAYVRVKDIADLNKKWVQYLGEQ